MCRRGTVEGINASVLPPSDGDEHGDHCAEPEREQLQFRRLQRSVDVGSAPLQRDSGEPSSVRVGPHHIADICTQPRGFGVRSRRLLPKLRAMALVASTHRLNSELSFGLSETESKTTRAFLEKHTINWMSSTVEVGQRVFVCVMWKDDA